MYLYIFLNFEALFFLCLLSRVCQDLLAYFNKARKFIVQLKMTLFNLTKCDVWNSVKKHFIWLIKTVRNYKKKYHRFFINLHLKWAVQKLNLSCIDYLSTDRLHATFINVEQWLSTRGTGTSGGTLAVSKGYAKVRF